MKSLPSRRLGLAALLALVAMLLGRRGTRPAAENALTRLPIPAYLSFPDRQPSGDWRAIETFRHLAFDNAVRLVHEPRSHRYYVAEREGRIWSFPDGDPETKEKTLVLDLSAQTQGFYDCGLLGLAFHPDFRKPGRPAEGDFFVWYNHTDAPKHAEKPPRGTPKRQRVSRYHIPSQNRLSRFRIPKGSTQANARSEQVLIDQQNATVFHEGGGMFFHPKDNFLYLSLGDDDDPKNAQTLDGGLFSGVIRIDVDCDPQRSHPIRRQPIHGRTAHYCLPDDNPFLDTSGKRLEEFWSLGLRSPHTLTLDSKTLRIWSGEVGSNAREEIDIIERGGNYEWPFREGTLDLAAPPPVLVGRQRPPYYEYAHGFDSCAIGGYVYRGTEYPSLIGRFVFGDCSSNRVWSLDADRQGAKPALLTKIPGGAAYEAGLASFAEGVRGEILLIRIGHQRIFKLVPARSQPAVMPALLSQVGAFTSLHPLTPRTGLVPYDVNVPQWADGALAKRWLALPDAATIKYTQGAEWDVPPGAVLIQHLELALDPRYPERRRPVETRFLVRDSAKEAFGVTYRWREDLSDADLVRENETTELPWTFPGTDDCLRCHNSAAGFVLGLNTRQLNRAFEYAPGVITNQLRAWSDAQMFDQKLDDATVAGAPRLVALPDHSASPRDRVRSYLDVNCSSCHRPKGINALFDARYYTPLDQQGLIDGEVVNTLGMEDARVVAPREPGRSLLLLRMHAVGPSAMPPVGKSKIDQAAVDLVSEWIQNP